jgi:hypothetical protein
MFRTPRSLRLQANPFVGSSAPSFLFSKPGERLAAITCWPIMPDRAMTLEHLEQARRRVAEGQRHIALQREIVAEKERDGHDTSTSKQLLDQFEQIYAMYVAERDRLEEELVETSK